MRTRTGRAEALHTTLSSTTGAAARGPGLAVLAEPELRDDPELVLAALRALIHDPDPEVFRTLLPFAAQRWAGGWLAFEASPCPQRGALLAEWLTTAAPDTAPAPLRWPTLPEPDPGPELGPELGPEGGPEMAPTMIERLWPGLDGEDRARLHAIAVAQYERAAHVRARERWARLRLAIGDAEHLADLRESAIERLRALGITAWLARDSDAAVAELGPLLVAGPQRPGDGERLATLTKILAHAEQLALALDARTGLLVHVRLGPGDRWQLGRFDPATRAWVDRAGFEVHVELGPARQPRLRFPKSGKRGAFVVDYQDRTGELLRHHVRPAPDGPWRHASRASELDGPAPEGKPKPEPAAKPEPVPVPVPVPAAKSKSKPEPAARYQIRRVGRGPSASEGRLSVPGPDWVGVYDQERDAIVLAPPEAVAIALAGDQVVVWAYRRRPGHSGVARADYDWVIEVWSLTGEGPLASHTVADRQLIAWCWPERITCAARTRHRIVRLVCRSEDERVELYLARRADGSWLETEDRGLALAAIRGGAGARSD